MIVCSCHCLSHREIGRAIAAGATRPCEVYASCGKRAECGGCVRSILAFLKAEAAAAASAAIAGARDERVAA